MMPRSGLWRNSSAKEIMKALFSIAADSAYPISPTLSKPYIPEERQLLLSIDGSIRSSLVYEQRAQKIGLESGSC